MLIAIDTSSLVLSCALAEEDRLIAEWTVQRKLTHSEQLVPHMDALMKEAGVKRSDITAVAVSTGPGSFTGLRIGLATAKMAALVWKVPLVGVDTLEGLAWNMAGSHTFVLPLMDAQRGNVYAALYGAYEHMWKEMPEQVGKAKNIIAAAAAHGGPVVAVGEAAEMHQEELLSAGILLAPPHQRVSRAGSIAMAAMEKLKQGIHDDPMTLLPNYIRRSEAEVLWEKRQKQ